MIDFRCRCSHQFHVEDERAGESFQCPACGLLVDVPTLDEVLGMQDDGSYTLTDTAPPTDDLQTFGDKPSISSRHDQRDRRLSLKEFLAIGTSDDDLLEIKGEVKAGIPKHPKYDPDTGELIVPLDMKKPVQAAPLTAHPVVLGYEVKKREGVPSIWLPVYALFELPNFLVLFIVTFMWTLAFFMSGVHPVFTLLALPVVVLTISHLANVVDETGPTGSDEMPRPMRGVDYYEDLIRPMGQVMFSYALASMPIVLFNLYVKHLSWGANVGLIALFYVLVPAILLTMITSGAMNNLVPSRALSVIGVSSWHYWVVAFAGYIATAAIGIATAFATSAGDSFIAVISGGQAGGGMRGSLFGLGLPPKVEVLIAPFAVFTAIYLLHVFAWQLGLLYRLHHEQFAWVLQKHESTRTDTLSQLHVHRQREAEARARQARANLDQRLAELKRG